MGCALTRSGKGSEYVQQAKSMWRRGVAALETGRVDEAESLLRQAAEAAPEDPDAQRHLAEALWQSGQRTEAVTRAELACRCAPRDSGAAVRAGQMRLEAGDAQRSIDWADAAIAADTRSATAWALRGRAHRRLGRPERALADFQQALRFAPNDPALLTDVAMLHRARGDHRRCLTTLHQVIDSYPPGHEPASALAMVGESYLALGRARDAADSFRVAASRGPADAQLLYGLAEAQAACGQTDAAIADARRAIEADAAHTPSRELLARLEGQVVTRLR
ncbi:MAG: tetratricopeptide repeat protein [Planctomycetota bacterium]